MSKHVLRPQRHPSYVYCDYHGEIHGAEVDYYGSGGDESDCNPDNWRKVYVAGTVGEFKL